MRQTRQHRSGGLSSLRRTASTASATIIACATDPAERRHHLFGQCSGSDQHTGRHWGNDLCAAEHHIRQDSILVAGFYRAGLLDFIRGFYLISHTHSVVASKLPARFRSNFRWWFDWFGNHLDVQPQTQIPR